MPIYVLRFGGVLILSGGVTPPTTLATVLVVAQFRGGQATMEFRSGQAHGMFRAGTAHPAFRAGAAHPTFRSGNAIEENR